MYNTVIVLPALQYGWGSVTNTNTCATNPDRHAWALRGRDVGRGPDCEPLLVDVEPLARLSAALLEEA